jgi:hypothetical protein
MPDLLAHIKDWDGWVVEMEADGLAVNSGGKQIFLMDHTPFVRNGNEALVYLRDAPGALAGMANVDLLGDYAAVLIAPGKRAIYDRIYPQTPYEVDGELYTPPEKFCVFAD